MEESDAARLGREGEQENPMRPLMQLAVSIETAKPETFLK
jgi:hypothetical protein